jgi:hypothetical protein
MSERRDYNKPSFEIDFSDQYKARLDEKKTQKLPDEPPPEQQKPDESQKEVEH